MTKLSQKQIDAYEAKGFNRWTKGNMDRLYINTKQLGAEISYYNTGNVSNAKWRGELVSNADGRRLLATKVWVDVNTGELHVNTSFYCSYIDALEVEEAAQELIDSIESELAENEPKADDTVTATITITGKREDVDEILASIYKKGEQMSLDVLLESIC